MKEKNRTCKRKLRTREKTWETRASNGKKGWGIKDRKYRIVSLCYTLVFRGWWHHHHLKRLRSSLVLFSWNSQAILLLFTLWSFEFFFSLHLVFLFKVYFLTRFPPKYSSNLLCYVSLKCSLCISAWATCVLLVFKLFFFSNRSVLPQLCYFLSLLLGICLFLWLKVRLARLWRLCCWSCCFVIRQRLVCQTHQVMDLFLLNVKENETCGHSIVWHAGSFEKTHEIFSWQCISLVSSNQHHDSFRFLYVSRWLSVITSHKYILPHKDTPMLSPSIRQRYFLQSLKLSILCHSSLPSLPVFSIKVDYSSHGGYRLHCLSFCLQKFTRIECK